MLPPDVAVSADMLAFEPPTAKTKVELPDMPEAVTDPL
jgi:hypothetical protein